MLNVARPGGVACSCPRPLRLRAVSERSTALMSCSANGRLGAGSRHAVVSGASGPAWVCRPGLSHNLCSVFCGGVRTSGSWHARVQSPSPSNAWSFAQMSGTPQMRQAFPLFKNGVFGGGAGRRRSSLGVGAGPIPLTTGDWRGKSIRNRDCLARHFVMILVRIMIQP